MGERYSGYSMRDRILDPQIKEKKQKPFSDEAYRAVDEQMKKDIAANTAARPAIGNMFSDSEDSDDLVLARLSPDPRFLIPTEEKIGELRGELELLKGGKEDKTDVLPDNVTRMEQHATPLPPVAKEAGAK